MTRAAAIAALVAGCALACDGGEPRIEYDLYQGAPPYPDQRPKLPAPKGYFGFVSDNGGDTISLLDLPSNERSAQVRVGRDPLAVDGPHHLAVDRAGVVYVAYSYPAPATLPGPHAAHAASSRPGFVQRLAAEDLHPLGEVQVDPNPGEIILNGAGTKLVVTHFDLARAADPQRSRDDQRATLALIDPASIVTNASPVYRAVPLCRAPHGASFAPDDRTVIVACYADDSVAILDTDALTAAPTIVPVGCRGPYSAVTSSAGTHVAVGCTDGRETRLLDIGARAMTETAFVTQGAPYFAAWSRDDARLWIPTQGPDALVLVDAKTRAVVAQRVFDAATCEKPHEAVLSRAGDVVYLVCEGDHVAPSVVLALDPATLETRASIAVGVYPDRLALSRAP
jgi:DNA-binding beta-propeller fold protein YncE